VTDDRAAEPGAALPTDVADDARFDLLAAPLAAPAPALHVRTHLEVTVPGSVDETPTEAAADEAAAAAAGSQVDQDDADDSALEPSADDEPHGGDQPDAEQPEAEQPVGVGSPEQHSLIPQAVGADAGSTGDHGAPPEPDARAAEPDDAAGPEETAVLAAVGATLPIWLPATAPVPAVPPTGPVTRSGPAPSMPRHRRQPWALLVLSILLALTLGLATYLLMTTRAYERRSAEWEAAARTTGSDLTQARADLEATSSDLAATRDQLATAQARIIELADEKAQLGDDRAIQRQLVDYQQRISAAAGNVATALNSCIDGQYKLIDYLENPSAYDQTDLARFRTDVQTVCGAATDANVALQRELKK
jgi:hypothetical protein